MTPQEEDRYLRELLRLLDGAKAYEDATNTHSEAWRVKRGSSLAGDDAKTDPYHLSHNVWMALCVAVDHLHCLRSTLVGNQQGSKIEVTLHTHGQYSLLRGAFENSARAVWLLSPPQRLARVQRRLSLQAGENKNSDKMAKLMKQAPRRTIEERMQQLTDLAVAAGTADADTKKALTSPSYTNIVRSAGESVPMGADQAEVAWSSCSAMAHGDTHGTVSILDNQRVGTEGTVALNRVTSSPKVLYWATDLTVAMLQRGFDLFKQRAGH